LSGDFFESLLDQPTLSLDQAMILDSLITSHFVHALQIWEAWGVLPGNVV